VVDEKRLAPGRKVRASDGMRNRGVLRVDALALVVHPKRLKSLRREILRERVHGAQLGDEPT
jgi:hypothetical protein